MIQFLKWNRFIKVWVDFFCQNSVKTYGNSRCRQRLLMPLKSKNVWFRRFLHFMTEIFFRFLHFVWFWDQKINNFKHSCTYLLILFLSFYNDEWGFFYYIFVISWKVSIKCSNNRTEQHNITTTESDKLKQKIKNYFMLNGPSHKISIVFILFSYSHLFSACKFESCVPKFSHHCQSRSSHSHPLPN